MDAWMDCIGVVLRRKQKSASRAKGGGLAAVVCVPSAGLLDQLMRYVWMGWDGCVRACVCV
jgi:hypothetical protein